MTAPARFLGAFVLVAMTTAALSARQLRPADAAQLAAAKTLYESASYEEALARLEFIGPAETTEQIEQYRALCFLALDRPLDAERSLELIVRRSPSYRMSDADVSPRLISMFAGVRRRVLPQAARETYGRAKRSFEGEYFAAAATELRRLLGILADPEMADAPRDVLDLRLVAEGLLKLAENALPATAMREAIPSSVPALSIAPQPGVSAAPVGPPARSRIYSESDRDVKAPIELSRQMPLWRPPPEFTAVEFRGVLELLIDEFGRVASAVSRGPVMPGYDETLRTAAKQWRYRPAMLRDGTPVPYRLVVGYLLKPLS